MSKEEILYAKIKQYDKNWSEIDRQSNELMDILDEVKSIISGYAASLAGDGWVSASDAKPELIEGKDYSENVLAIVKGSSDLYVMCWTMAEGENEKGESVYGGVWANCYGRIDSDDAEWDDDYEVTHWQKLPPPPKG